MWAPPDQWSGAMRVEAAACCSLQSGHGGATIRSAMPNLTTVCTGARDRTMETIRSWAPRAKVGNARWSNTRPCRSKRNPAARPENVCGCSTVGTVTVKPESAPQWRRLFGPSEPTRLRCFGFLHARSACAGTAGFHWPFSAPPARFVRTLTRRIDRGVLPATG